MKQAARKLASKAISIATLFCMSAQGTLVAAPLTLAQQPLFIGANTPPQVMLAISKDQQLYKKAYNDYSDLDTDGQLETTYKHAINYYGYFDPVKCYKYDVGNNRFTPDAMAQPDKYCVPGNSHWSGNFLNWVSMSRMDTVRKLLYGGMRSTDTVALTVLERSFITQDAHAWAKYYNGSDIAKLTPFNPPTTPSTFNTTIRPIDTVCVATAGALNPTPPSAPQQVSAPSATPVQFEIPPTVSPTLDTANNNANCPTSFSVPPLPKAAVVSDFVDPGNVKVSPKFPTVDVFVPLDALNDIQEGDQIRIELGSSPRTGACKGTGDNGQPCVTGAVNYVLFPAPSFKPLLYLRVNLADMVPTVTPNVPGVTSWTVTNLSRTGISFCNLTPGSGASDNLLSHTNTNAPLIRVAKGNFALWNANELYQCYWKEQASLTQRNANFIYVRSNGNVGALSEIFASAENPIRGTHGLGSGSGVGEYYVRVEACKTGLFGSERCKQYGGPGGNFKPIGLLQEYGDAGVDLIRFGLMTGSYKKNISGGVLRKNISSFSDEVFTDTGIFKTSATPPGIPRTNGSTPNTDAGIVNTLNYMRIWGYNYASGNYISNDGCNYQQTNIVEDSCVSWGNPMAEIYFESLRYFAGKSPTPAYNYPAADAKDNQLGLPAPTWTTTLLTADNYCAPLNVLVFNASVSTNDDDLRTVTTSDINATQTPAQLTSTVGDIEGITNNSYFVGKLLGGTPTPSTGPGSDGFELCTPKTIPGLGDVSGICPEGPTLAGSYLMAGLAYHARTNRIRTDISGVPTSDTKSLKVTTYGIQLATNVPQIVIPVPGPGGGKVIIQPIYRLFNTAPFGGGTLVDMKVVRTSADGSTGKVYLNWEDSEQGGDYDQDLWGTLEWVLSGSSIKITTTVVSAATANPQGFGYTISGTTQDGPHFHSGIFGFNYTDTASIQVRALDGTLLNAALPGASSTTKVNLTGGCANCQSGEPATTVTYSLGSATAGTLQDPLWYASKYGSFVDSNGNNKPDLATEWDKRLSDGTPRNPGDGTPDTYFLVTNPLGLVNALNRAFVAILSNASASSVATNSTSLQTGTTIYQARFNANDWSGQVLAFGVNTQGVIATDPTWDAGQIVSDQSPTSTVAPASTPASLAPGAAAGSGRAIVTYNDTPGMRGGVAFRWPSAPDPTVPGALSATDIGINLVKALNGPFAPAPAPTPPPDGRGSERLMWLRGSQASENDAVGGFRRRDINRLGDVVNSNPNFVAAPNSGFGEQTYVDFRQQNINRKAMIYVGGNDGMLHGFRAEDGREVLAYVPSMVHRRLNRLMEKTYVGPAHRYFVDGSPEIGDALVKVGVADEWRTVLVSGLGAGAQGLFALNVTRPDLFSESSAQAANIAMWEFSDKDDPDIGYVMSQPTIRKMANGKWAAIVSGGYNNSQPQPETNEVDCNPSPVPGCTTSTTGANYLFIIFLDGPGTDGVWDEGTDYIKIRAVRNTGTGLNRDSPDFPVGLSQPLAADTDANGTVDFIYAGDLRGNLWKFDLRSDVATNWRLPGNRVILFVARDPAAKRQPITAKPEGTLHPNGGFVITFGTGKYLEPSDPFQQGTPPQPYQVQSFYGIWDKNDRNPIATANGDNTSSARQTILGLRTQLLPHEIVSPPGSSFRFIIPVVDHPDMPDWSTDTSPPNASDSPPKHMGWVLDFPNAGATGERSVFRPILTSGRLIFTTLLPLTQACQFGGTSFTMVIDPITGTAINAPVLDTDNNGLLNASDRVTFAGQPLFASGVQSTIGITPTPTIIRAENSLPPGSATSAGQLLGTSGPLVAASGVLLAYALSAGSSGGNASTMIGLSAAGGRVSWREITSDF